MYPKEPLLEQLDQQGWPPVATYTMALAFSPFGLIPKHGWMYLKQSLCNHRGVAIQYTLMAMYGLLFASTPTMASTITYTGTYKTNPVQVTYTFTDSMVESVVEGKKIHEVNQTHIANNQLVSMIQTTHNDIDQEYFEWHIEPENAHYAITFKNHPFNETFKTTLEKKQQPMTLQGLLYMIQSLHLTPSTQLKANLITPWKTLIPTRFLVTGEANITIQNKRIPAYIVSIQLDSILRHLLPKTTIWVSKKTPHRLLKQTGFNGDYVLTNGAIFEN